MLFERKLIKQESIEQHMQKFKNPTDDNTYSIDLEKDKKKTIVRLIPQKIVGVTKIPVIKEFLDSYKNHHKIMIFDSITDKAKASLSTAHTEVFTEDFFMINITDHIDSPKYEILSEQEVTELLNTYNVKRNNLNKILTSDPIVSYFNLKRGQVIRILRCSEQTQKSVAYRIVAKG